MFNLEALLSVPLSMTILAQAIFYLIPIELRIEKQAKVIIEDRISQTKNLPLYEIIPEETITKLKVNPQKVKEIMSLALDIDHSLWNKDEAGDD